MQNFVFVLDNRRRVLDPCHPAVARKLMSRGRAREFRRYPEILILDKDVPDANPQPLTLKIDPGSQVTGFALVNANNQVIWAAELTHQGQAISASLTSRNAIRRNRRSRKTRYRKVRFQYRTKDKGWIAPSLMHRVLTIETWVKRICRYANVTQIVMELVRFDTQAIQKPEISGTEYQQGTLLGYECREYLLEKWGRTCAYCGAKNTPLQIEHIYPKSKGGSDRVSNLTVACEPCNTAKGTLLVQEFLASKPDVLNRILAQAKAPLRDAAVVNSTRWALFNTLKATGLPVSTGSGGQTKYNRTRLDLPKTHWLDAACVGRVEQLQILTTQPLLIKATGHGNRQMCGTDRYGFPIRHHTKRKVWYGFQTGDLVVAKVPSGKFAGRWTGRISVRSRPSFKLVSTQSFDVHPKYLEVIHRADDYNYGF
ncbi:MAG TPA: RNA-guided endonuclease IscB [Crinalium sp.]|jgi:5-methylcytosine-specific restriction endonuclease McrA